MLKTIFSLKPNERYQRIGQTDAKKIVRLVSNYSARSSMKPIVRGLGTSKVSVNNFVKKFKKSSDVDKIIRAVQKNNNKGVDPEIQKKYMKAGMQRDESVIENNYRRANLSAAGEIGRHGVTSEEFRRTKGAASNLNIGTGVKTGFAANYNNKNLPNSSTPKSSLGGSRPIGL